MKRLCVFYKYANAFQDSVLWGRIKIDWIVCQKCRKRLAKGDYFLAEFWEQIKTKR